MWVRGIICPRAAQCNTVEAIRVRMTSDAGIHAVSVRSQTHWSYEEASGIKGVPSLQSDIFAMRTLAVQVLLPHP